MTDNKTFFPEKFAVTNYFSKYLIGDIFSFFFAAALNLAKLKLFRHFYVMVR